MTKMNGTGYPKCKPASYPMEQDDTSLKRNSTS